LRQDLLLCLLSAQDHMCLSDCPMASVSAPKGMEFDMVEAVSEMLDRTSFESSGLCAPGATKTPFDACFASDISIHDYAKRLQTHLYCSDECFILGLVYIDRIMKRDPTFMLTELNVHRLLLAATVVAAKFQDDDVYGNEYYARIGGVSFTELATVETHFFMMLGWSAHVTLDEYQHCLGGLRRHSLSLVLPLIAGEVRQTPPEVQPLPTPCADFAEANSFDMHTPKLMTEVQAGQFRPLVTLDFAKKSMSPELSQSEKANAAREWTRFCAAAKAEISNRIQEQCLSQLQIQFASSLQSIGETLKQQTKSEDSPRNGMSNADSNEPVQ